MNSINLIEKLEALFAQNDVPMISWTDIVQVPDFGSIKVDNSQIESIRIPLVSSSVLFKVTMPAGSRFELHKHDCKEMIRIVSGTVRTNDLKKSGGDTIVYQKGIAHYIEALTDAELYIQFLRPY